MSTSAAVTGTPWSNYADPADDNEIHVVLEPHADASERAVAAAAESGRPICSSGYCVKVLFR